MKPTQQQIENKLEELMLSENFMEKVYIPLFQDYNSDLELEFDDEDMDDDDLIDIEEKAHDETRDELLNELKNNFTKYDEHLKNYTLKETTIKKLTEALERVSNKKVKLV